jgi:hypothetical protein
MDLSDWPTGMRVIARAERPHPNDRTRARNCGSPMPNGNRLTALATNTKGGQLPDLGLRHRRRARCADRIRNAKDTDLKNPPLQDFSHAAETAAESSGVP